MGKRNKKEQIVINDEELQTTTLGYLEDEKRGPFGLIFLFLIFIVFAFFLPEITNYVNKLMGKNTTGIIEPTIDPTKKDDKDNNEEEAKMYDIADSLTFDYTSIKFSEFKKYEDNNKYYISFRLDNNSDKMIDLSKSKYFIETYSEDKTLLERHIFNYTKLNTKSYTTEIIELSYDEYNKANKIIISYKTLEDYPEVTLNIDSNSEYILSCSNSKNKLIYTFNKDSKLVRINDTVNYANDNSSNYANALINYRNQVANFNNIDGISSSLVEITTGFTVTTDVNVKTVNLNSVNNSNYYGTDAIPKEVKFEMESRGYNCN